jgi:PAS domain-containing protein
MSKRKSGPQSRGGIKSEKNSRQGSGNSGQSSSHELLRLRSGSSHSRAATGSEKLSQEQLLQVSRRLSDRIIRATPYLVYIYDLIEGQSVFVNPHASQVLGYPKEKVEGIGTKLLLRNLHPEDVQPVVEHLARLATARDDGVFEGRIPNAASGRTVALVAFERWLNSSVSFSDPSSNHP